MLAGVYLAPEGLMKDADDIAGLAGSIDETRYDNRYEVLTGRLLAESVAWIGSSGHIYVTPISHVVHQAKAEVTIRP